MRENPNPSPYGIRKVGAASPDPVGLFATEAGARAEAERISRDQGGAAWEVILPAGHDLPESTERKAR